MTRDENAAGGIDYLHSYHGSRPILDYNKCGQAAVVTILDYYGLDPYGLERPVYDAHAGGYHWRDDRIIDRIKERFPGAQISRALAHAGLETRVAHSTDVGVGREIWEGVKRLANAGYPVVVILDCGMLGGCPFTAHWGGSPNSKPTTPIRINSA